MNFLFVFSAELREPGIVVLAGARAERARAFHPVGAGGECTVLIEGRGQCRARVVSSSPQEIILELSSDGSRGLPSIQGMPMVHALVGLPRPQIAKRVIEFAAVMGFAELHFVGTDTGEKSYQTSKVFEPLTLQEHLLRGVEQGGVPRFPRVNIWRELRALCNERLGVAPEQGEQRWYADTRTSTPVRTAFGETEASGSGGCWIAIGPESGWSEREHQKLLNSQFTPVSLGAPILRVDQALSVLTGVLLAVRSSP